MHGQPNIKYKSFYLDGFTNSKLFNNNHSQAQIKRGHRLLDDFLLHIFVSRNALRSGWKLKLYFHQDPLFSLFVLRWNYHDSFFFPNWAHAKKIFPYTKLL